MDVFEGEKSSTNILKNGTMRDDEVVASDVPPRYLFHLLILALCLFLSALEVCQSIKSTLYSQLFSSSFALKGVDTSCLFAILLNQSCLTLTRKGVTAKKKKKKKKNNKK